MRRGPFIAAIVLGAAVPTVALIVAVSRADVRAALKGFVSPLPVASPLPSASASVASLPPQMVLTGAESAELHGLAAGDAGAPTRRAPRTRLFPVEVPAMAGPYERPRGLRRTDLAARDDPTTDKAAAYLHTDGHGHAALVAAVKIAGRHRDEVERILRAWKLPPELAALAFVESGFSPTYSALDGMGLWSLPREVGHAYGLAVLDNYDERRGVDLSTEAAGHYIADLHERFGSWELALFAFGMGYRPALDALANRASLDYWDIAAELPPEGTAYVAQVLAVATLLDNPTAYGLDVVRPDPPEVTSDMEVPGGAGFTTIARAAGTSVEHLRELNPEYLGDTVPSTGFVMVMHLPSAGLARAKEALMPLLYSTSGALARGDSFDWGRRRQLPDGGYGGDAGELVVEDAGPPPPQAVTHGASKHLFYRVQDGDTLESVSRRFGLPREAIISDNSLDPSAGLRPGQTLILKIGADGSNHAPP
jgi:hypothetical protein